MISLNGNAAAAAAASAGQAITSAASSRIVPKPFPQSQVQDTRVYQIQQLTKRFSPKVSTLNNGVASLTFKISPSDPDFPFELDHLDVEVRVPASYPKAPPTLSVKNQDIPRGFAINIERGWDRLVAERRGATLLSLTNALDKNLEAFLSEEKTETIKMTIFKDTRHLDMPPASSTAEPIHQQQPAQKQPAYAPEETFTRDQMTEAKARRARETRQLESRLGRLPLYQKSSDGIVYTLPLEPRRRGELPMGLRAVKSFQFIIPLMYPLQQIRILLNDVESSEAEPVEQLFVEKAAAQRQMSLMSHVNFLTQNIHFMAKQTQRAQEAALATERSNAALKLKAAAESEGNSASHLTSLADVKSHVHVIPRPPEWSFGQVGDPGSSGSEDDDYSGTDDEEDGGAAVGSFDLTSPPGRPAEKGTAINFPSVELFGIELLEITSLSISIKCLRCKALNDMGGLKPGSEKSASCKKCATGFLAVFRPEMVHQNSNRAGFISLAGCTVADLLPSTFVPTCSKCSTATTQGFVSVRGDTTTNVCRECHARFTFKIPDVKFQSYSAGGPGMLPPATGPRRRQEKLGLHAGEPLPSRGSCEHYKKSYRWFRFSCCDKIFPCDKCHDAADGAGDGHVHEWANRMICGWCSREQNYRVDSCAFCGRSVIGRKGTGYWEGGKGTRDQLLMRKNDRRKHRRIGGGGDAKKKD